jgi:hypothetical protein
MHILGFIFKKEVLGFFFALGGGGKYCLFVPSEVPNNTSYLIPILLGTLETKWAWSSNVPY